MARIDYLNDPDAPTPNSMVPAVGVIATDDEGRILLQLRTDNQLWALPGGAIDLGESLTQAAVRETREETGYEVEVTGLVGIYTNPRHLIAYDDGEVRQEFNICLRCQLIGGAVATSEESAAVGFVTPAEIDALDMHPSVRLRIQHHLEGSGPHLD